MGGFVFAPYGFRIRVCSNDPDALVRLRRDHLLASWDVRDSGSGPVDFIYSFRIDTSANRRGTKASHVLCAGEALLKQTNDLDDLFDFFDTELHIKIASTAVKRTFVHAAAVGFPHGAILIPGRSHSGKSTLAKALADAGGILYSDEYAVIDQSGKVHPYPRPLSIRQKKGPPVRTPVEKYRGGAHLRPLQIAAVVLTRYERGASFQPTRVTAGQAVLGLVENTPSVRANPSRDLRALGAAVSHAVSLIGPRGSARETARILLRTLAHESPIGDGDSNHQRRNAA